MNASDLFLGLMRSGTRLVVLVNAMIWAVFSVWLSWNVVGELMGWLSKRFFSH